MDLSKRNNLVSSMPPRREPKSQSTLVVGLGSPHGDDQLGWMVAKAMLRHSETGCTIRIANTPMEIMDWIEDCTALHLVDACQGSGEPGKIHRWDWPCEEIQTGSWSGTHDFNLLGVLALAEELGQTPEKVIIWGIEGSASPVRNASPQQITEWVEHAAAQIQSEILSFKNAMSTSRVALPLHKPMNPKP